MGELPAPAIVPVLQEICFLIFSRPLSNAKLLFYYGEETGFGQQTPYVQIQLGVILYPALIDLTRSADYRGGGGEAPKEIRQKTVHR